MFPHKFDRYNLFNFLVFHYYRQLNINRKELADQSGLSISKVRQLLNFEYALALLKGETGTTGQRLCKPDTLTKACNTLKISEEKTIALSWLLDQSISNDDSIKQKEIILEMLDEIVKGNLDNLTGSKSGNLKKVTVELAGMKGFYKSDLANENFREQSESLQERLFQMSCKEGHRMVVSKFPTSATHPKDVVDKLSLEGRLRVDKFDKNIRNGGYGERHIHSKSTIERYLNEESDCSLLPIDKRKEHIENLIKTLENKENIHFEIGLSDEEPEIELAMRSIDVVGIRTTAREILLSENPFACGPSYLFLHDKMTVLSCFLDFEREWRKIPQNFREKESVITWLKQTLHKSIK